MMPGRWPRSRVQLDLAMTRALRDAGRSGRYRDTSLPWTRLLLWGTEQCLAEAHCFHLDDVDVLRLGRRIGGVHEIFVRRDHQSVPDSAAAAMAEAEDVAELMRQG